MEFDGGISVCDERYFSSDSTYTELANKSKQ